MSEIDWKNSGIYVTANGIVGYCLNCDLDVHNPRDFNTFDDNQSGIFSFVEMDADDDYRFVMSDNLSERRDFIYDQIRSKKNLHGLKLNPDNTLSMCHVSDADWGFICSRNSLVEMDVLEQELKIFNHYRLGQEYCAFKYSFDGKFIEMYEYLYGSNPEDAGVPLMMGEPIDSKYLKSFNLDSIDVEEMILEGIFLDNFNLFDFFKSNLEHEHIIDNVYEFNIDGFKESFNMDEFVPELFSFIKKIKVKDRINSKVLNLVCSYLMNKVQEVWDESYGKYGWT